MHGKRRGWWWIAFLTLLWAPGCGGGGNSGGGAEDTGPDAPPPLPPPPPPPPPPIGDGTFTPASRPMLFAGERPTALATGDFDEDGVLDFAVGDHLGDLLLICLGAGDATFSTVEGVHLPSGSGLFDLRTADVDGDTHLDLVTANSFTNTVSVFLGAGDGTFSAAPTVTVPAGNKVHGVALADFDGDGALDLAATVLTTNQIVLFGGGGDGTFVPIGSVASGAEPRQVHAADVNEDGVPDLLTANFVGASVSVHLGQGDGTFVAAAGSPVAVGNRPWNLAVADFDGDGHLDFASPADSDGVVRILLGAGDGSFAAAPSGPVPVGAAPYGVAAGDFSGDGRPDLAVAAFNDDTVSVLLGTGAGAFTPASEPLLSAGDQPYALAVGDFTGDGVLDLIVAAENDGTVRVYVGDVR